MTAPPYMHATSGNRAREEIKNLLSRFGCSRVGFLDDFEKNTLTLGFTHRERNIQLEVSAAGWANMYLGLNPWTSRRWSTKDEWENAALTQGVIACNSILRDWIKGQITAVECGLMRFEHVFLPHMLTASGQTIAQIVDGRPEIFALPAPDKESP